MLQSKRGSIFKLLDELLQRKTVRSFAERLAGLDMLSPGMRAALEAFLDPLNPPSLILLAPAQSVRPGHRRKGWRLSWEITPNQVLLLTHTCLLVASTPYYPEQAGCEYVSEDVPEVFCIPFKDILYLESGFVLLTAWFECVWIRQGALERTRACFNTVSRELFEDLCGRIRASLAAPNDLPLDSTDQNRKIIASFPYKFRSLIPRHLLMPGERIQAAVFMPTLWEHHGWLRRFIAPRRALLRTSLHLILCEEDPAPEAEEYGFIARFLPLARVMEIEQTSCKGRQETTIHLGVGGVRCRLSLPFESAQQADLNALLEY